MPVGIPRVPLFRKGDKKDRDSKYRDMYKKFHLFGLEKERDPESDNERDAEPDNERAYREYMHKFSEDAHRDRDLNERDREADYERERAYSEFISRFEDDQDGGEEAIKEEDKQKEKKEEEEEKRKKEAVPLVDLFTRMYFERVLFLFGEIDDEKASKLIAILHYYSLADPKKRFLLILLIINSPGGGLAPGIALYDALQWATQT